MATVYQVCIPNTHRDYYDYLGPADNLPIGVRVWLPFRKQTKLGILVGQEDRDHDLDKLKSIAEILDHTPVLDEETLDLCQWISSYYQSPLSEVIALALPKKYRMGEPDQLPLQTSWQLALPVAACLESLNKQARKQRALIEHLAEANKPLNSKALQAAGFTTRQCQLLADQGLLQTLQSPALPLPVVPVAEKPLNLNEEQAAAKAEILKRLNQYHCFLLQGVTGSGKTEVYLQVIAEVLAQGRQVLILVPEIGLTPQLQSRFQKRLSVPMAIIHSKLNETERQQAWALARAGEVRLLIGTRAAVFTPLPQLGLIIIDEEHDSSLKQMEGVRYSARDTALMRAHRKNIPIILGTATPSLESLYNAQQEKYTPLFLRQKAVAKTPLHYQILDIRSQSLQHGLAQTTLQQIKKHLDKGNQVLVFINRRGFSPVLLCHQCSWIADCPACDAHLTLHKNKNRLICHHCGLSQSIPYQCPKCSNKELLPIGAGTQRIYDYLESYFSDYSPVRIDRDEVRGKHEFDLQLQRILNGEVQLIIGTQMLAKGHHFPRLSLVVVLEADTGLYNQDFRALERFGQLLTQVAGRAGREQEAGEVLIQTHLPQHPLLNLLVQQGYEAFAQALLQARQEALMPPYHYLAVIRAQGRDQGRVLHFLHLIKDQLKTEALQLLGPAPAPLALKASQYRMQLLIKSASRTQLKSSLTGLRAWLDRHQAASGIRWNIDVDPQDLS